jgi:hypothetical protein
LTKVTVENISIIEASKILSINPSTAKTILRIYKKENRALKKKITKDELKVIQGNLSDFYTISKNYLTQIDAKN